MKIPWVCNAQTAFGYMWARCMNCAVCYWGHEHDGASSNGIHTGTGCRTWWKWYEFIFSIDRYNARSSVHGVIEWINSCVAVTSSTLIAKRALNWKCTLSAMPLFAERRLYLDGSKFSNRKLNCPTDMLHYHTIMLLAIGAIRIKLMPWWNNNVQHERRDRNRLKLLCCSRTRGVIVKCSPLILPVHSRHTFRMWVGHLGTFGAWCKI